MSAGCLILYVYVEEEDSERAVAPGDCFIRSSYLKALSCKMVATMSICQSLNYLCICVVLLDRFHMTSNEMEAFLL